MSSEFISRLFGMILFMIIGARMGASNAQFLDFPPNAAAMIFALLGMLFGLILMPYLTVRPLVALRRVINEVPVDILAVTLFGLAGGLVAGLVLAYPISLLAPPLGTWLPAIASLVLGYLGMLIFGLRAKEFLTTFVRSRNRPFNSGSGRELLLDTSVLIDGRIVEVAQTGFLGGTLLVPRFVLSELHQVADSSDALRRNRGRRGLAKLNELQRDAQIEIQVIEDDVEGINAVDDKLVALGVERDAIIVTNDYNLNQVAEAQGVVVLNINELANAVREIYIPGETLPIHIIQEGRENQQGVGYLEDGTMVVVEEGKQFLDRTVNVEVTKLITRPTGRMLFAKPSNERR